MVHDRPGFQKQPGRDKKYYKPFSDSVNPQLCYTGKRYIFTNLEEYKSRQSVNSGIFLFLFSGTDAAFNWMCPYLLFKGIIATFWKARIVASYPQFRV